MELNAIVKYGSGSACFNIRKENAGIYCADLLYFDDNEKLSPPQRITLIRGLRQWAGSYDNIDLLNELGKIIEEINSNSVSVSIFK